ncbi:DNA photolyase phr1 [Rhodotorula toruloides]|uniref:Deoxyribodipyrimidine photo-lyase n=1 Tax=Rhodotorula toruloides (strain NP11) TaxID=1130832 RepID=M7XIV4_RHOT1|nr:deoxyribodipyrimidine photo-lyase [Rhodotorula toruloides NP11]EMS20108.1 deoxyribodipyrimidine photo-lyase [Rhodotorula toruloides NP11]
MAAPKRVRSASSSASPVAENGGSAKKRARRSPTKEDEDVKPTIKEEADDDDGSDPRFRSVSTTAALERDREHTSFPHEMEQTPLARLYDAMRELSQAKAAKDEKPSKDGVVVYWMRNKDLRREDNTALSYASAVAQEHSLPLIALHIFSLGDYKSHDRSPRRIDFQLRQLAYLRAEFDKLHIPLFTFTQSSDRKAIPRILCEKLAEWNAFGVYANIEYEVDELRRDIEVLERTRDAREKEEGWNGQVEFFKDFCIVAPGELLTKQGKPYSVYSPWQRAWAAHINSNLSSFISPQNGPVIANLSSARTHPVLEQMFSHEIPTSLPGFELAEQEKEDMERLWPVGEGVTEGIMGRFLKTKMREAKFFEPPLEGDGNEVENPKKDSKIAKYTEGRNRVDWDGTSHISAYLAAGLISPRECVRAVYKVVGGKEVPAGRDTGFGMWIQEVAWRDFYQHVLAAWPRVCMSKPFNLKYDGTIEWATDDDESKFEAWKEGKTGFPIVDAAMRSLKAQGYMHNRCRMIVASFLCKDLLLDWRKGEKYFMQMLVDGDLGSNNGGRPLEPIQLLTIRFYASFRIFNPASQSEKVDPNGTYIRHWVPELKSVKGKAIHNPSAALSKAEILKLGYVPPIVDHAEARKKAIEAYKEAAARGG